VLDKPAVGDGNRERQLQGCSLHAAPTNGHGHSAGKTCQGAALHTQLLEGQADGRTAISRSVTVTKRAASVDLVGRSLIASHLPETFSDRTARTRVPQRPPRTSASCKAAAGPPPPGRAIAELGRIVKTLYLLAYLDDEPYRRRILTQLNRIEARHALARQVFHGKRGQLRQRYREGQEDQLRALGLVLNAIVLWNTRYLDAALAQLRLDGYPVKDADVERLSPLTHDHINLLGRYHFTKPDNRGDGRLRPLRDPRTAED